jgi:hypothetical protein
MANRFIEALSTRGDGSLSRLKRLYRAACKRVHPDASPGAGLGSEAFIALRGEYEAALVELARAANGNKVDRAKRERVVAPSLMEFRRSCALLGDLSRAERFDPYAWAPPIDFVEGLLASADKAFRELPSIPYLEQLAISTLFSGLAGSSALLRRYPGAMTRAAMLYRALGHWSSYEATGKPFELHACRARLLELSDPTVTIIASKHVAEVVDAFPPATAALLSLLGLTQGH